jgi:hypothetical protein
MRLLRRQATLWGFSLEELFGKFLKFRYTYCFLYAEQKINVYNKEVNIF